MEQKNQFTSLFGYILIVFLLGSVIISLWGLREAQVLHNSVISLIQTELQTEQITSDVFISEAGWGIGQFAPSIAVTGRNGEVFDFYELATIYDVIYLAWDQCPICLEHFPYLNEMIDSVPGKVAMVILTSELDLEALQNEYNWHFQIYAIDQNGILELNVAGTPTVLVFRNGVLGRAFSASGLNNLVATLRNELN